MQVIPTGDPNLSLEGSKENEEGRAEITDHKLQITKGWGDVAREAAVCLTGISQENNPIGSLLMDIFLVYILRQTDRVFSRDLVAELLASGDRPWAELRKGKPVTEGWLAKQLRPYGVSPRTIRIGDAVAKGYLEEDFTAEHGGSFPAQPFAEHLLAWRQSGRPDPALEPFSVVASFLARHRLLRKSGQLGWRFRHDKILDWFLRPALAARSPA